jgi:RNA polymerase sigma-70 factor (ECF subfamily)
MMGQEVTLLLQAQDGNAEAYGDLQVLLEADVRRFVRRIIQHTETEDDIVQEVFIKFYLNLHKINPPESLRPYLFRIARNCCYDDLRRLHRAEDESLDEEPVEMRVSFTSAHQQPKPDDLTHWMLLGMEVRVAIDMLPEAQRQALILFSEEGLSYAEIAEVMEINIGTVKSRLHHAKKTLRAMMRPETVTLLDEEFGNTPTTAISKSLSKPRPTSLPMDEQGVINLTQA